MKTLANALVTLSAAMFILGGSAAVNDVVVTFSTPGVDTYADGTRVLDGECYALVYTPAGRTFAGFGADGRETDPETGRIVLCAPVAKDGRCPTIAFEIDAALAAASYPAGSWSVYLLDTRVYAGGAVRLAGTEKGRAKVVNGYGAVAAGTAAVTTAGAPAGIAAAAALAADRTSSVPEDTPRPTITGIRVADGLVYITVKDTVPYLAYEAKEVGDKVGAAAVPSETPPVPVQGDADREITIVRPAQGQTGLFQVGRK